MDCIMNSIWLKDVSKVLDPEPQSPVYYHGFDISSQQFPKMQENIQFSVHDITKPFPEEHLGRYDLVHVRLLVAAIDESDYKLAVANIDAILSMFRPVKLAFFFSFLANIFRARWLSSVGGDR